jgi:hypothetical protein
MVDQRPHESGSGWHRGVLLRLGLSFLSLCDRCARRWTDLDARLSGRSGRSGEGPAQCLEGRLKFMRARLEAQELLEGVAHKSLIARGRGRSRQVPRDVRGAVADQSAIEQG